MKRDPPDAGSGPYLAGCQFFILYKLTELVVNSAPRPAESAGNVVGSEWAARVVPVSEDLQSVAGRISCELVLAVVRHISIHAVGRYNVYAHNCFQLSERITQLYAVKGIKSDMPAICS